MAQYFEIHPQNPQKRLIREAVTILKASGVIVYPTDSLYALGCQVGDKAAMERMRWIRDIDDTHHLTLMCRNLSQIGEYARLDNRAFRLMKESTPGSYTFILQASRDLPRRVAHARSKTIGVRIPGNPIAIALLEELGEPMLSTSLLSRSNRAANTNGITGCRLLPGSDVLECLGKIEIFERIIKYNFKAWS